MATALFALSAINVMLLVVRVKRKAYFYFNSIFQLVLSFFLAGLLGLIGITLFALNLAILITLREKKGKRRVLGPETPPPPQPQHNP